MKSKRKLFFLHGDINIAQIAWHYFITDIHTFSIFVACNRSMPCKAIGLENAYTDKNVIGLKNANMIMLLLLISFSDGIISVSPKEKNTR
jgi:hypothetical protein